MGSRRSLRPTREFVTVAVFDARTGRALRTVCALGACLWRAVGILPFAAILAIVGLGQMLVVQQGGFDLSVPGGVSLAVVITTHYPAGDDALLPTAIALALACAVVAGLINGILIGIAAAECHRRDHRDECAALRRRCSRFRAACPASRRSFWPRSPAARSSASDIPSSSPLALLAWSASS